MVGAVYIPDGQSEYDVINYVNYSKQLKHVAAFDTCLIVHH